MTNSAVEPQKKIWFYDIVESDKQPTYRQLQKLLPPEVVRAEFQVQKCPKMQWECPAWKVRWTPLELMLGYQIREQENVFIIDKI